MSGCCEKVSSVLPHLTLTSDCPAVNLHNISDIKHHLLRVLCFSLRKYVLPLGIFSEFPNYVALVLSCAEQAPASDWNFPGLDIKVSSIFHSTCPRITYCNKPKRVRSTIPMSKSSRTSQDKTRENIKIVQRRLKCKVWHGKQKQEDQLWSEKKRHFNLQE